MSQVDKVTKYYEARAPVYDETAGYQDREAEQLRIPIKTRYREMFSGHDVLEIACGTGYWTSVIAEVASSVSAVDINPTLISQAQERCRHLNNVKFQIADAYTLQGVSSGFSAAFGIWWLSHVPKELITTFIDTLHRKLLPGAFVLFVDQLMYGGYNRRQDSMENTLELRHLPDGRSFEIIKNFPSGKCVFRVLITTDSGINLTTIPVLS